MPALAVIEAMKSIADANDITLNILYLGSKSGMEGDMVRERNIRFSGIETGKLRRSKNPLNMINRNNINDMFRVPVGFMQAVRIVSRFKPNAVLSTGGYVSVPGVLASSYAKVPVVAHEQTAQIGFANKINFKYASKIALSINESLDLLPDDQKSKATITGNPLRSVIFGGNRDLALTKFGFDSSDTNLPTIYVTGGAQGSHIINQAIADALPELLIRSRVIHQCGRQQGAEIQDVDILKDLAKKLPDELRSRYAVVETIGDEIGDVYALADVIIGRSGAGTVSEICALGKPSVLIPLVPTGGDEQTKNAKRLEVIGAAKIIQQSECNAETLMQQLIPLLDNQKLREQMGKQAQTLSQSDSATRLSKLVFSLGGITFDDN